MNSTYLHYVRGLRGIAILFVVWFHFTYNNETISQYIRLPHGYYGVDVFLAIMGYFLIKGFLHKDSINIYSFLKDKVNRITLPVSILVLLTLLISFFSIDIIQSTAETGLSSILGVSNIYLEQITAGYFAEDTSNNPLMHMWYVGVTLQVYVLFIAGYSILKRFSRKWIITTTCLIAVFSFVFYFADDIKSIIWSITGCELWRGEIVSYYSTLPRLWEVIVGGLALFLPNCKNTIIRNTLFCAGLLSIIIPSVLPESLIDINLPFIVIIGTVLVIQYGNCAWGHILLENAPLSFIGKISFSLYLVHMPIFVLYRRFAGGSPDIIYAIGLLAISIAVAYIFYVSVEKRKPYFCVVISITIFSAACCLIMQYLPISKIIEPKDKPYELPINKDFRMTETESLYHGFDKEILCTYNNWHNLLNNGHLQPAPKRDSSFVMLGNKEDNIEFVVVGDSHAIHICPGMDKICKELGVSGVCLNTVIMPLWNRLLPYYGKGLYYDETRAHALLNWLKVQEKIKYVVIGIHWHLRFNSIKQNWDGHVTGGNCQDENVEALKDFCSHMKAIGKEVLVFYPEPFFSRRDMTTYAKLLLKKGLPLEAGHPDFICTQEEYTATYSGLIEKLENLQKDNYLHMLDIRPAFFRNGEFKVIRDGKQLYKDNNHFTIEGSIQVMDSIKEEFYKILRKS